MSVLFQQTLFKFLEHITGTDTKTFEKIKVHRNEKYLLDKNLKTKINTIIDESVS
jgi:hypothetical protein